MRSRGGAWEQSLPILQVIDANVAMRAQLGLLKVARVAVGGAADGSGGTQLIRQAELAKPEDGRLPRRGRLRVTRVAPRDPDASRHVSSRRPATPSQLIWSSLAECVTLVSSRRLFGFRPRRLRSSTRRSTTGTARTTSRRSRAARDARCF